MSRLRLRLNKQIDPMKVIDFGTEPLSRYLSDEKVCPDVQHQQILRYAPGRYDVTGVDRNGNAVFVYYTFHLDGTVDHHCAPHPARIPSSSGMILSYYGGWHAVDYSFTDDGIMEYRIAKEELGGAFVLPTNPDGIWSGVR